VVAELPAHREQYRGHHDDKNRTVRQAMEWWRYSILRKRVLPSREMEPQQGYQRPTGRTAATAMTTNRTVR
jgi:hypothetical protein